MSGARPGPAPGRPGDGPGCRGCPAGVRGAAALPGKKGRREPSRAHPDQRHGRTVVAGPGSPGWLVYGAPPALLGVTGWGDVIPASVGGRPTWAARPGFREA